MKFTLPMAKRLDNYIRGFRKKTGLSQREIAFLLGCRDGTKISRYERFAQQPSIEAILRLELILDTGARHLFAGIFETVEADTIRRAQMLARKLSAAKESRQRTRKLETLSRITSGPAIGPVTRA